MQTSIQLKKKMSKSKYWKFQPNEVLMECNVASIVSESNYGVLKLVHKIVFLGNIGDYFGFDLTLIYLVLSFIICYRWL